MFGTETSSGRCQNLSGLVEIFKDFLIESKPKKLCYFKVGQFEIFEKYGCPPFETNATVRNTFTWDVQVFCSMETFFSCFVRKQGLISKKMNKKKRKGNYLKAQYILSLTKKITLRPSQNNISASSCSIKKNFLHQQLATISCRCTYLLNWKKEKKWQIKKKKHETPKEPQLWLSLFFWTTTGFKPFSLLPFLTVFFSWLEGRSICAPTVKSRCLLLYKAVNGSTLFVRPCCGRNKTEAENRWKKKQEKHDPRWQLATTDLTSKTVPG